MNDEDEDFHIWLEKQVVDKGSKLNSIVRGTILGLIVLMLIIVAAKMFSGSL